MSEPGVLHVAVECYAGYRGEQTPRRFHLGERTFDIEHVIDAWLGPDHRYFKVRTASGKVCILRHDVTSGAWELTRAADPRRSSMSDAQIHAKAVIAAAIIQTRGVDVEGLASQNKDISNRKLAHLQELTERIYSALATDASA